MPKNGAQLSLSCTWSWAGYDTHGHFLRRQGTPRWGKVPVTTPEIREMKMWLLWDPISEAPRGLLGWTTRQECGHSGR